VTDSIEGKKKRHIWRLRFTAKPDSRLPLIAGDFLYNVRAALDYLIAALVPSSERSHVMFPCLYEPIWQIPFKQGENQDRTDSRQKWNTTVRKMPDEAVTILKSLQPVNEAANFPNFHVLGMLNRLSNRDRHRQLTVLAWGLKDVSLEAYNAGGSRLDFGGDNLDDLSGIQDGARIRVPEEVMSMEIRGAPVVVIRDSADDRHIRIPDSLRACLLFARDQAVVPLAPYVRG
jgi:hypothetical protein